MNRTKQRDRTAMTLTELLIASSLIVTMAVISMPMVKKVARFQRQLNLQRLAMDELSNQLESLMAIPNSELAPALSQLEPSAEIRGRLENVNLVSQLNQVDGGTKIELQITWKERPQVPLTLSTWIAATWTDETSSAIPANRDGGAS